MTAGPNISIRVLDWAEAEPKAMPLRLQVFVVEQGVPVELERDEFDAVSKHALAETAAGEALATGRLLPDGHIGRMAVAASWRGRGLGGAVLEALVAEAAARGMDHALLNAQTHALDFYRRHGFVEEGKEFMEAGIPHRTMRRTLERNK